MKNSQQTGALLPKQYLFFGIRGGVGLLKCNVHVVRRHLVPSLAGGALLQGKVVCDTEDPSTQIVSRFFRLQMPEK
ncbi:hypothetical protein RBB77_06760 [Tunturibacter psychrotolerans]|uniref:Uncharacterized protein n=1 Tax=Tunturiibacter psychrotolerans TaxID=3069686 RepID=A0AAU7ZUE0_9BACT